VSVDSRAEIGEHFALTTNITACAAAGDDMKAIGVWVLGLALAAPVYAQDETAGNPDYQDGNSFSDVQDESGAADAGDAADQVADTATEAATDDAMSAESDAPDTNSFGSDTSDANSFSDASDANSFSSDTSDANSFSSDAADANSFSSDSGDANSFSDDSSAGEETASDDSSYSYGSDDTDASDEARSPIPLYFGADYVWTTASFSNESLKTAFGSDQVDSNMVRLRGGVRMFKKIGLEVQYGFKGQGVDETSNEYKTSDFYAVYLVPTGVLLNTFEVGASIGYASTTLERGAASETISGASFGVNVELPVLTTESFDIRIGGGGTVFRAQPSARIYGYHAGIRLDFRI